MFKNKRFSEITLKDVAMTGVFDDIEINKENFEEAKKALNKVDQLFKKYFIKREMQKIKGKYQAVDDLGLMITDYLKENIGNKLTVVAHKTEEAGPAPADKKKADWYFRGIMTRKEFLNYFPDLYPEFVELYSQYYKYDWDLELNVICGILGGQLVIDREDIIKYRKKGVLIEPWGFNKNRQMVSSTELLIRASQDLKKEAASIKKAGGPENLDEARLLKLDREGKKLFSRVFC